MKSEFEVKEVEVIREPCFYNWSSGDLEDLKDINVYSVVIEFPSGIMQPNEKGINEQLKFERTLNIRAVEGGPVDEMLDALARGFIKVHKGNEELREANNIWKETYSDMVKENGELYEQLKTAQWDLGKALTRIAKTKQARARAQKQTRGKK